jgi:UDP-N-acetylglucosamine 2-epimerase (non-hydrolysing)
MIDSLESMRPEINKSQILNKLDIQEKNYSVLTLHRPINVDHIDNLEKIFSAINLLGIKSIFPIHPRTEKRLTEFNIVLPVGIKTIRPANYTDFISLQSNARLIMTDSGGVQEEACIFRVPCVTLRDNTERPETEEVGANFVSGTNSENIVAGYHNMMKKEKNWENPFGDGNASKKILDILFRVEL